MDRRWAIDVGGDRTEAALTPAAGGDAGSRGRRVLVLAHGAGSHLDHPATLAVAGAFAGLGLDVVRFDFLYRALGKGRPDPMPRLTACFAAVVDRVRRELEPTALLLGGRSMGGRAASVMAAGGFDCDGLILVSYPLHPPRRTDRLRDGHLARIAVPTLLLSGTRDDLCARSLMDQVIARHPDPFTMHWIEGADHGFKVLKRSGRTEHDVLDEVAAATGRWLESHLPD